MFKQISKSHISTRNFQVYKEWTLHTSDSTAPPIIHAYNETTLFDPATSNNVLQYNYNQETRTYVTGALDDIIYTYPLWRSIKSKYYSANGNVFNQYGLMENPYYYTYDRQIQDDIYVIDIAQIQYGEQIKRDSVRLTDHTNGVVYVDDKWGRLKSDRDSYLFIELDAEDMIMTFRSINYIGGETDYDVTVSELDMNTGIGVFTWDVTDNYVVFKIDFQTNLIEMAEPFYLGDDELDQIVVGNVFYDDGLIVITNPLSGSLSGSVDYTLEYRSVQTIHETEILVSACPGEFNYSQNPSAVDVFLENTTSFTSSAIYYDSLGSEMLIKEIQDISRVPFFYGTTGSATGSWDDYDTYQTTDPTGSYITTYISTIGIYDDEMNMVAVAKLPTPIKNLPDYDVNFLIRLDL
jgi:hypothetical protein